MCGIWAVLNRTKITPEERNALLKELEARGPEYSAFLDVPNTSVTLGFTRLAINGLTPAGHQPITAKNISVVCNGEIYNYKELAQRWNIPLPEGTSDCAILPYLADVLTPAELCRALDGVFAFVIVNHETGEVMIGRDPYGVRPLFVAIKDDAWFFASEIKGLPTGFSSVAQFPPGSYAVYKPDTGSFDYDRYHHVSHVKLPYFNDRNIAKQALQTALVSAVKKRLLSDRPIGSLLSGGLDSSLIAAIAARELGNEGKKLTTFSIGMPGSTDLEYAQKVADHIGSIHHTILVKPEDFLAAIPHVVRAAETYDITSVRASVGNYLVGKYIKENTDIKVVFNGDGSDEIGGGYLYFYAAPSDEAFETETERLLDEISMFDVLRSDRSMASHGLEARTPFLDKSVVATWCSLPTAFRRPSRKTQPEKAVLREAFEHTGLLPSEVLWRKKEAFSDGVSSTSDSWYLRCADYAKSLGKTMEQIGKEMEGRHNPPTTEEAYWYRTLFEAQFGLHAAEVIPHMWMPKWIAGASDPSARTLKDLY